MSSASTKINSSGLWGILRFFMRYRPLVIVAISMLLVIIGLEMMLPRLSGLAINQLTDAVKNGTPYHPWRLAGLYMGIAVVRSIIAFVLGRIRNLIIQRTLRDIRAAYFDAVQRLSFSYHDKTNTGELISRGTADISRLQDFLFACIFLGIDIAVATVSTIILIAIISPIAGLITLLTVAPTTALIIYYARKLHPQWREVHDLHGKMTTVIQENIAGVRVVKAFAREKNEINKFQDKRDVFVAKVLDTVNYWTSRVPKAQFIFGLSMPIILWVCGGQVIRGEMRVGDLAMIVFYLLGLGNRMGGVGQLVNIIQNASASAERVMEVLEEPLGIKNGTRRLTETGGARVTFKNVSFSYPSGKIDALHEVSFEAEPGQTIAVVGATGSGKSTLVHMIPRFYEASEGEVQIDGIEVSQLELDHLRRSVGMIFQETVLFSTTVADNISYGNPEARREEVVAAARASHAYEFISNMDRGFETIIGERGVSLSGGQKQRLAIARAFLLNPRVLILDDATSSLDSKTERLIQEDMRRVCIGRTAFVIAHRLTTVQRTDFVLVMQAGRIVERGTPQELMERGTYFKELFREQWGDRDNPPLPISSNVTERGLNHE